MPLSNEIRRLETKWQTGNSWPKFLEWLEIKDIRGWSGQRVPLAFPIVAIVGENGSGKSTILRPPLAPIRTRPAKAGFQASFSLKPLGTI